MAGSGRRSGDGCHLTTSNRKHRSSRSLANMQRNISVSSSSDSEVEASPYVHLYAGSAGCLRTGSVRRVETLCGTHTYAIVGYTLARTMGPGTRLCSEFFEVGGQLFRLEAYPAGLDADTHKYVSVFLTTPGTTRPNYLLYELSILDKSQSRSQHITESRTVHTPSQAEPAALLAPQPGVVAAFPKFIKANFLHRNAKRFLRDDTLTIRATVKVLTGRSSFPVAAPGQPHLFSVQPNMGMIVPLSAAQQVLPAQTAFSAPPPQYSPSAVSATTTAVTPYCMDPSSCRCGYYGGAHQLHAQLSGVQQLGGRPFPYHHAHAMVPFPAAIPPPAMILPQQLLQFPITAPAAAAGPPGYFRMTS